MFNGFCKYVFLLVLLVSTNELVGQTAPSSILPDLVNFKLTFPLDNNGNDYAGVDYNDRDDPHIVAWNQLDLNNWVPPSPYSDYFYVQGNEVVFKAHCAGALTSINAYPRCELRERPNGTDDLWEFSDEHELDATFRITHLPDLKQEVCVLQIKGNTSNNTSNTEEALRLEYRQDGSQGFHAVINENTTMNDIMAYSVGNTIVANLYVNNDSITVTLDNLDVSGPDGEWNYSYESNYSHGYFKAGCYTQSSIWVEKNGVGNESPTAYGEVKFSALTLLNSTAAVPAKVQIEAQDGDVYIDNPDHGIIMKSADGTCFRITIQNDGTLGTSIVTCPQ